MDRLVDSSPATKPTECRGLPNSRTLFSGRTLLFALLISIPCVLLVMLLLGVGLGDGKAGAAALASVLALAVLGEWVRQRFRFSVRSLLLIMTALAILMGLLAKQVIEGRRSRATVLLVQRLGGSVSYDFQDQGNWFVTTSGVPLPNWLRKLAGDETFGRAVAIRLWGSACGDRELELICRQLKGPEHISVAGSSVTAKGIEHLQHCEDLKTLELDSTQLSPEGVRSLAVLSGLKEVSVVGNGIDRAALAELRRLRALRSFQASLNLTDGDLQAMSGIAKLEELLLRSPLLTDSSISHLAPWAKDLQSLNLIQTQLTDAGVRELVELCAPHDQLTQLALYGAPITDDSIDDLARLRTLRYLSLNGTLISEAGKDELQNRLPQCHITR